MKTVLFATTASAALLLGGMASAQGISLFGDARLGLLYDKDAKGGINEGSELTTTSRVRFGVNMTGETDSGITFGASVRADNSVNGAAGKAGSAFVSGNFGTLTFGDTAGADENWVGDVPGNLSLTGLSDQNETPFFSNGGGFDNDDSLQFANNPNARPTVRYDFDIMGFGISVSSDRTLRDIVVGGGWAGSYGDWELGAGLGYNSFAEFTSFADASYTTATLADGTEVLVPVLASETEVPGGNQFSASMSVGYSNFSFGVVYTAAEADDAELDTIHVGGTAGYDAFTVGAYYSKLLTAKGYDGEKISTDDDTVGNGSDSYGLTAAYDLGGGASVNGGIVRTYNGNQRGDFGIKMSF